MNTTTVTSTAALLLAAVALGISLTHSGPRGNTGPTGKPGTQGEQGPQGPAGPQGNAGTDAQTAHLGVCVTNGWSTLYGTTLNYVEGIYAPTLTSGVASCPNGSFTSIVPQ